VRAKRVASGDVAANHIPPKFSDALKHKQPHPNPPLPSQGRESFPTFIGFRRSGVGWGVKPNTLSPVGTAMFRVAPPHPR
jgi:hypothetical protein